MKKTSESQRQWAATKQIDDIRWPDYMLLLYLFSKCFHTARLVLAFLWSHDLNWTFRWLMPLAPGTRFAGLNRSCTTKLSCEKNSFNSCFTSQLKYMTFTDKILYKSSIPLSLTQISGFLRFNKWYMSSFLHSQRATVDNTGTLTNLAAFDCPKITKIGLLQGTIVPTSVRRVKAMVD